MLGMLLQRFEFVDHLRLRAQGQDDPHDEARRLPHPGPAPCRRAPRPRRSGGRGGARPSPSRRPRRPRSSPGTAPRCVLFGSNLGTAEAIATRLAQEGTERGFDVTLGALDDHVDDLPRDGAALIVCSSYNGTPPDNAAAFCRWIRRRPHRCGRRRWPTPSSAAATPSGPPPTRPSRPCSTSSSPHTADAGSRDRGEGNAAGDFDAAYRDWHSGLWADLAAALDLPAEVGATAAPTGPRLSITLTNRQVTNPVIVSYRRPAGAGPGQPRAHRGRERAAGRPLHPAPRDRAARPGRRTRRATTWGCCRATASTSSAG